jgi:RNA polymerase Rpc34 subunit
MAPPSEGSIESLKKKIYAKCLEDTERGFTQRELESLASGDAQLLMKCINLLMQEGLLQLLTQGSTVFFKAIKQEDREK